MPDKQQYNAFYQEKISLRDNGDGTFSPKFYDSGSLLDISLGNSPGIASGDKFGYLYGTAQVKRISKLITRYCIW